MGVHRFGKDKKPLGSRAKAKAEAKELVEEGSHEGLKEREQQESTAEAEARRERDAAWQAEVQGIATKKTAEKGEMEIEVGGQEEEEEVTADAEMQDQDENTKGQKETPEEAQARQAAAERRWEKVGDRVADGARQLCEQLRLVLEPTLATKLRGDFKSGKRINLKRIVPFIASQYKRDKIWMRRTAPVKRTYQVLIAVDDSLSMTNMGAAPHALDALAMLWRALQQLEVGEVGVMHFGGDQRAALVHELDAPLSDATGASTLARFSFRGSAPAGRGVPGPFQEMMEEAMRSLGAARERAGWQAGTETLQLLLIVSDGRILGEQRAVERLVRECGAKGILPVLILLDYAHDAAPPAPGAATTGPAAPGGKSGAGKAAPAHSILDIKSLTYEGGKPKLTCFIDSFPLPYYILLRDMAALPSFLADALKQWFELVATQGT